MSEPSYVTAEEASAYLEEQAGNPLLRAPSLTEGAATWRAAEAVVDKHVRFVGGRSLRATAERVRLALIERLTGEPIVPADGSER